MKTIKTLKKNGIIKIGTKVLEKQVIIGKVLIKKKKNLIIKLLNNVFLDTFLYNSSINLPKNIKGVVHKVKCYTKNTIFSVTIFIKENLKLQVGDKLAGRHGNKGIISNIVLEENMPFLPDGRIFDILLSPLGIPSRMNVGQIFECILGLAAVSLVENYKVFSFDEKQSSKTLIYTKLLEARTKTLKKWLINFNFPGKIKIFDGKTGLSFNQPVLIGYAYILKLMHVVTEKINARLIGPYSAITKQPLRGKLRNGGQRVGEMEIWALEGFGASYILHEMLTIKSDDLVMRSKVLISLAKGSLILNTSWPETLKNLILELQSLGLEINIFLTNYKNF